MKPRLPNYVLERAIRNAQLWVAVRVPAIRYLPRLRLLKREP